MSWWTLIHALINELNGALEEISQIIYEYKQNKTAVPAALMLPVTQIQENLNLKNKLDLTSTYDPLLNNKHANFSLTIDENIRLDAAHGIINNNWKSHNRYYLPNGDGIGHRFLRCWGTQGLREDTRFCLHRLQTPFSRCRTGCH